MASPVFASSLGSSLGAGNGSLGARTHSGPPPVEVHIERCWTFDLSQHATKCRKDAAAFLEDTLEKLAKDKEPSPADDAIREATIARLQALLPEIFPPPSAVQLVPYGSFVSECYTRTSDLDLALAGSVAAGAVGVAAPGDWFGTTLVPLEELPEAGFVALLTRLADELEARGVARGQVTRILEARVPIIKFVDAASGIECDFCVTTRGCDFKGAVMRLMHRLQPSLAPLTRLVKLWAKQHDINSAHAGTLNSWSLALMALFAQQAYPGGHLAPPLWRLFHEEEPSGPNGAGRPLQDKTTSLDAMLATATAKCEEEGAVLVDAKWASAPPPSLLEQLLWFLSCFTAITGQWRDNAAHRNWRVSPWLGRGCTARFPRPYVAAVEEPFDCNDNTARSVGVRERNENTLPYIAWVFGHSVHLLRNVGSVTDAARALAWLFGPDVLPYVGIPTLQLPKDSVSPELQRRMEALAAAAPAAGDAGAAAHGYARSTDDECLAQSALRAIIDATKIGSPITTIDDWRSHAASSRQRPPFGWHRLAPPPASLQRRNTAPPAPPGPGPARGGAGPGMNGLHGPGGHMGPGPGMLGAPHGPPGFAQHAQQHPPQQLGFGGPNQQHQPGGMTRPPPPPGYGGGGGTGFFAGGAGTAADARSLVAALHAGPGAAPCPPGPGQGPSPNDVLRLGGGPASLEALRARLARDEAQAVADRARAEAAHARARLGPGGDLGLSRVASAPHGPPGFVSGTGAYGINLFAGLNSTAGANGGAAAVRDGLPPGLHAQHGLQHQHQQQGGAGPADQSRAQQQQQLQQQLQQQQQQQRGGDGQEAAELEELLRMLHLARQQQPQGGQGQAQSQPQTPLQQAAAQGLQGYGGATSHLHTQPTYPQYGQPHTYGAQQIRQAAGGGGGANWGAGGARAPYGPANGLYGNGVASPYGNGGAQGAHGIADGALGGLLNPGPGGPAGSVRAPYGVTPQHSAFAALGQQHQPHAHAQAQPGSQPHAPGASHPGLHQPGTQPPSGPGLLQMLLNSAKAQAVQPGAPAAPEHQAAQLNGYGGYGGFGGTGGGGGGPAAGLGQAGAMMPPPGFGPAQTGNAPGAGPGVGLGLTGTGLGTSIW
ncbi:hypothetical protein HYH03_001158 [Edaphochlamys debaryana]|uniref:Poly(A) RNA polymerase mitochondrial-like central palm domain-containing protein n=1 Tax=Edaphochlamys debaryana TaxID=47281 RepID=A0A835YHM2_9CHLO|nr:hypothetical protein HYH03_001158 [Edaphochlamys debaryana]|eukprot:KAG2501368.1 hypothetical protein HYH03_001158 [Edaphochlamys debaryana]